MDGALSRPEISVVASHPEYVLPTAMSEVVGNDGLDVDLGFLTSGFGGSPSPSTSTKSSSKESDNNTSVLKELWSGVVDDIFGSKGTPKAAI